MHNDQGAQNIPENKHIEGSSIKIAPTFASNIQHRLGDSGFRPGIESSG
jgi:hypothetical protein